MRKYLWEIVIVVSLVICAGVWMYRNADERDFIRENCELTNLHGVPQTGPVVSIYNCGDAPLPSSQNEVSV